ncbi:penicillin-binding protein 2 [Glaciimonas sp. CA11.2]|uniref:peptidoglycan D,D-transpeptidase FtsI family protein n=1 Tax=unclassified Glaciimonas TaxID=2644401 RepID=UPI002AB4E8FD|nr:MULTISPECIES: penicillin-binding protein 2 [unclassified Glaciimonas]MDY7546489.1 penicillin-binding protein 2 [Glaciimonas sp. CA11.2]MEB0012880.1 penicillin-binding protein 2 [Glaciimonas sp. Cout2]MEB0080829.1 penicillin-binding protein 2 [Glaciimonas sp. Gout2]MEB0161753.1 penicillin-binding protein 2 [Glaciimonas sp. CA11.2]
MTRNPPRTAASKGMPFTASPVLKVKLPVWRSRVVLFMLFAAFFALVARALWLQGVSTEFLQKQGASRYARTLELPATRGKITDRNGQVLASSVPVKAIWAIPDDVQQAPKEKLQALAKLLDMTQAELNKKLDSDRSFVYLKRQVEKEATDQIAKLGIAGIETRPEYKRFYPEGEVAAHVVGFTNIEDAGQDGMELSQQKTLAGATGSRRVIKDRLGRIVEDIEAVKEPHDGRDLVLSIDSKIQYIAFTQLKEMVEKSKAKAGAIVVVDAKSGEVLALANLPSYNPNDRSILTGAQLRNRVMTDTFEPGSTLKPFTVALALDTNRIQPGTTFQVPDKMTIGTATIGDSHPHGLLSMTVAQIIQKSSNLGTAQIALQMPAEEMWEMFTTVGLGQQPKFGFPGAVAGRVRPFKSWRPIEQATMSYGHGISVSLIQMAHAYTIFARNGDLIPLSFKKVTTDPIGQRVISEKTALTMRAMLERVTAPGGTAPKAQVPGYRVGGKTGTAYKIEGGKYVKKYIADFVGFAPASDPRLIVAVMIDEPSNAYRYGGDSAAPVFASVVGNALRTLNVPPDSNITDIIIPTDGPKESF